MHDFPKKMARVRRVTSTASENSHIPTPQINGHINGEASEEEVSTGESSSEAPSSPPTIQKIRFVVRLRETSVVTPANIPLPKKYSSFGDFLDRDELEPRSGQDILSPDQVRKEAVARRRLREARKPGHPLDPKFLRILPDPQTEPRKQFAHQDHLLAHISHFAKLLKAEHKDHVRRAGLIAHEAKKFVEDKIRRNTVKTPEEIEAEKALVERTKFRGVVKDLEKQWMAVDVEVMQMRQQQWEEERAARARKNLDNRLDEMAERHKRRSSDDHDSDSESNSESSETDTSDDEQNMSEDEATESEDEGEDEDANLSPGELKRKYAKEFSPVVSVKAGDGDGVGDEGDNAHQVNGSSPAPASILEDAEDSDTSVTMDSEDDVDSDSEKDGEDKGEEDSEDEEDDESDSAGQGLSSLFSKRELAEILPKEDEASEIIVNSDEEDLVDAKMEQVNASEEPEEPAEPPRAKMELDAETIAPTEASFSGRQPSQDPSTLASPQTSATKATEVESASSLDPRAESQIPATPAESKSHLKTPVPHLLRGTLREYQHEGLDWLADLYATGRNGILADEMGLGKTIQSIALLAHLAVEHEVWGPHLIIVPTSVMLNWEMEFKKFCPGFKVLTYYGTQEERKQKRRGWMAEDSFNVCITSYQLVLQDQNSFKRRAWHYMILDEAHNIKNFHSKRWQTMMTFNTRARLLLTGTPLQNNLTELWSLLYFVQYGQGGGDGESQFAGLEDWSEWFGKPANAILEGQQKLSAKDKESVAKLHQVLRPYLLRRLKANVEKEMPLKYEHIELCRLSKRQRHLYDGFMSRSQTKEMLSSGNYMSIINALMQLRKVCNHPDLFETRPVTTSFVMGRSAAAEFEIQDFFIRRKLYQDNTRDKIDLDFLQLVPISREDLSANEAMESSRIQAYNHLKRLRDTQWHRADGLASYDGSRSQSLLESLQNIGTVSRLQELDQALYFESFRHRQRPIYGRTLLQTLFIGTKYHKLSHMKKIRELPRFWESEEPIASLDLIQSIQSRSESMELYIRKFACITPIATAIHSAEVAVSDIGVDAIRQELASHSPDPFHEARIRLSIGFPDKRLLQYDCGKLQSLDRLLRRLQSGGHRVLIFTQMTKVLDILEQFLNIHGHRYLRLDGNTKVEERQLLTERFNSDPRILTFILSSRSGGLGINLTGADTVIFYDLDWNPAMDKQCTDRAHRIGQTRDVHIYRFVSEHTIEANILRKANQKQMLDDVVIQEGDFTTDYLNRVNYRDMLGDGEDSDMAGAAMDRVLGNDQINVAAFEGAEDKEDIEAAKAAAREEQHADDGDFEEKAASTANEAGEQGVSGSVEDYLVRLKMWMLKDVPIGPPRDKAKKARRKGEDVHRIRKPRL
jgi:helicase SWR1